MNRLEVGMKVIIHEYLGSRWAVVKRVTPKRAYVDGYELDRDTWHIRGLDTWSIVSVEPWTQELQDKIHKEILNRTLHQTNWSKLDLTLDQLRRIRVIMKENLVKENTTEIKRG
jgi:hypothetical protein